MMNDRGTRVHTNTTGPGDDNRPQGRATYTGQIWHIQVSCLFQAVDQGIATPVKSVSTLPVVICYGNNINFFSAMGVEVFHHTQCRAGMATTT
jgi:hypothetical protein